MGRAASKKARGVALVGLCLAMGCIGPGGRGVGFFLAGPLRISQVVEEGDAIRRASTRLVVQGLGAGDEQRGISQIERAIAIDATNPYAYLALASIEVQWGDVDRGVRFLDQAVLLLESENLKSPRVDPHLAGLYGRARVRMRSLGRPARAGDPVASDAALLERARRQAPGVWGDGWLTAAELR